MNIHEFSNQFDVLLNSYNDIKPFGNTTSTSSLQLNEYEKSVFLTNSQNDLIIDLYSGRNTIGDSYEQSEELRRYLSSLNTSKYIEEFMTMGNIGLSNNSVRCFIDDDVLWITQEQSKIESEDPCINDTFVDTYPILRDEYNRIKNNPFRNNKVWRVDLDVSTVELISKTKIKGYKVSYIKKPAPIILEDLGDLSIEGLSTESECELNPNLHKHILEKAVISAFNYMTTKVKEN